ncbi:MAG: general secretion pathway protein GspK [Bdellovibrio sp.]|nr:MAG: general secretion pathway protein GspK [Bdellovibrio sp.]
MRKFSWKPLRKLLSKPLSPEEFWTTRRAKDQKGIALLLAIFSLSLLLYLAMEVQYDTQVEYSINSQSVNRLKAYYAARSGVELSLLRIKIFQQMKGQLGQQLGNNAAILNLIWNFPFAWPPVLPPGVDTTNKDLIDTAIKAAKMDASYQTTITDEGTKIDINDLDSPSKALRTSTKKLIMQIFENEVQNNTDFNKKHRDFKAEDLVDQITDWIDANKESQKGGSESQFYGDYVNPGGDALNYPPNRQFRTVEELRLIPAMNDEIFRLLEPRITVYGAKAINPNTASADVIQSIDVSITNEIVTEVLKRRQDIVNGGSFHDAGEFWSFINGKGARITPEVQQDTPIVTDAALNFRIQSIGSYGTAVREIDVIVYDLQKSAQVVAGLVKKEATTTGGTQAVTSTGTAGTSTPAQSAQSATKGPPRIVYWVEK